MTNYRKGYTLVELLAVVVIISILAAIAIPTVKNILVERKTSVAAIEIKGFLEAARARAIARGRPVSVILERLSSRSVDGVNSLTASNAPVSSTDNFEVYNSCIRLTMAESLRAVDIEASNISLLPEDNSNVPGTVKDSDTLQEWRIIEIPIANSGRLSEFLRVGASVSLVIADRSIRTTVVRFATNASNYYIAIRNEGDATHTFGSFGSSTSDIDLAAASQSQVMVYNNFGTTGSTASIACTSLQFEGEPRPIVSTVQELPRGTSIDLSLSGLGSNDPNVNTIPSPLPIPLVPTNPSTPPPVFLYRDCRREFSSDWAIPPTATTPLTPLPSQLRPIYLTFSANGVLESILCNAPSPPVGPVVTTLRRIEPHSDVFLFVGRNDQIIPANSTKSLAEAQDASLTPNLTDPTCYWVRISPSSGAISASLTQSEHILEDIAEYRSDPDANEPIGHLIEDSRSLAFTSEGTLQ